MNDLSALSNKRWLVLILCLCITIAAFVSLVYLFFDISNHSVNDNNNNNNNNNNSTNHPKVVNSTMSLEMKRFLYGNDSTIECGTQLHINKAPDSRVIGGRPVIYGEFPWHAALGTNPFHVASQCGGIIIGNHWILSAAHCFYRPENRLFPIYAVLGVIDLTIGRNNSLKAANVKVQIASTFLHPKYNELSVENDIALLKTVEKIDLSGRGLPIVPACLPDQFDQEPLGNAFVTGFGRTETNLVSTILRTAELPLMTYDECKRYYGHALYPGMLCAGYKEGGIDSCEGDSGGPLVQFGENNRATLIGIVSWGHQCALPENPGVYTKVSIYIDWIFNTIEINQ